jgi:hypothetical protein
MSDSVDRNDFAFHMSGKYRIRVLGQLDEEWSARVGGLQIVPSITADPKKPVIEMLGNVRDQAELLGILETLYDLHLTLVSVELLED